MKRHVTLPNGTKVTIESADPRLRTRLAEYVEAFPIAEGVVTGFKTKTKQLIDLTQGAVGPGWRMYRVFSTEHLVAICMAPNEQHAIDLVADALIAQGYSKRCKERLSAVEAVGLKV